MISWISFPFFVILVWINIFIKIGSPREFIVVRFKHNVIKI